MKRANLRNFLMLGLFAILAIGSVHAQTRKEMTANIPFSFNVGEKSFPAGEYNVTRLNPASDKAVIAIKSEDGRLSRIALTIPVQASRTQERARLVFNHYGDQYYLAQVWTPADDTGLQLLQSKTEQTVARRQAERKPEQTSVALNIRRK
ncbi:MAG TPA: hypothetical protein VKB86_16150 [Pyrinomonadaceae bacterium]|nr:hypothetical protein [Pyrinomonadaceae bacterium]